MKLEGAQTSLPAFKRWFGKSKVVDADGNPLVVYHGTSSGGFSVFDLSKIDKHHNGFFFASNRKVAESYGDGPELPSATAGVPVLKTLADVRRLTRSASNLFGGWRLSLLESSQIIEEEDERLATAHGSLNDYDRRVPVILLPFGRTRHEPQTVPNADISLADVAGLVASWLGVPAPSSLPR